MNSEAKASRSSPAKVPSHVPFSVSSVTASRTVPTSVTAFTSIASDTIAKNEKRLYNAEMRKNRRNKKEKLLEAAGTKESHASAGVSKSSAVVTSNSSPMTSTSGKVGLHPNNPSSSETPGSSANSNSSTSQSSANSKRKRNDIVKPVGAGKSGEYCWMF